MLQLWVDFTSRKCRADLDDIHRELMRLQQILISTVLIYDQMLASRYSMIMDLRRRIYLTVRSLVQYSGSRTLVLRAGQARSATCRIDAAVYYREYKACVCLSKSCSDFVNHNCFNLRDRILDV
jgi:hypothetical protein